MQTDLQTTDAVTIACDPSAIPTEARAAWIETGKYVYAAVQEIKELPDGYRFRLPADTTLLLRVAEYISNERLCCAFLHFTVEVTPGRGPFWLSLTGGEGVKAYIAEIFSASDLLNIDVAMAAGLV